MVSVVVISASFAVAFVGLLRNNKRKSDERGFIGLNPAGIALILISTIGFVAGLTKEISSIRKGREIEALEKERTDMLVKIDAKITGLAQRSVDKQLREELNDISRGVSQAASVHESSDFSMSNFRGSNFQYGLFKDANFSRASFQGAILTEAFFGNANLSGADLSGAIIDSDTKLPIRR